jgi:hypothetical protein
MLAQACIGLPVDAELLAPQQPAQPWAGRDLLAPGYGWFTEGLDTADLKNAKGLPNELA